MRTFHFPTRLMCVCSEKGVVLLRSFSLFFEFFQTTAAMNRSVVLVACVVATAVVMVLAVIAILSLDFDKNPHYPCSPLLTVDLSHAIKNASHPSSLVLDGISYPPELQFEYEGTRRGCVCEAVPAKCVQKCCLFGQIMVNSSCYKAQEQEKISGVSLYNWQEPVVQSWNFYILAGQKKCQQGWFVYPLLPKDYDEDEFFMQADGKLFLPYQDQTMLTPDFFCLEYFQEINQVSALVCYPDNEKPETKIFSYGMIVSMPFLLITFIVYAFLPDRNLHGKSLMCYVISLFGAYLLLVVVQLTPVAFSDSMCKTIAMFCYFFFMVSFFWMNVMSIDIWWAFSGLRGVTGSKRHAEQKRFLIYCGYAWGAPILLVILVSALSFGADLNPSTWYNPSVGDGQCWFREGMPTFVYFYLPMTLIIVANITFFVITAFKINRVQRDTSMLRKDESKKHSYENDKQRFNLYLKLMLAMGINWSLEIISWAIKFKFGNDAIWYLTDFGNALYGVFIFFIFVFKRNIWKLIKRRYYSITGKPLLARSMTQTGCSSRTTASSLNHTLTTSADCKSFSEDGGGVILTTQVA